MRILILELERYGPFTNRILKFTPTAKLHVVYGANEAGKSCALAAMTDLFFGIERQTKYDFLHEGKDLRIGATILAGDKQCISFLRRKGNKNTLLDSSGKPLNDAALLKYLGGITREIFSHAFGLDSRILRRGAEEMLRSEGDIGATLFAAASGMRGLADLRHRMEEEAAAIFGPRFSKDRKFYQALNRFEVARKAIVDLELRAGSWRAINQRIEQLSQQLTELQRVRRVKAAEAARLSRNKRAAPLLRLLDRDLASLAELGEMPEFPVGFARDLRERLETVRKATEESKRTANAEIIAAAELDSIQVDESLLERAEEVERLVGQSGGYGMNNSSLLRIQAEIDEYDHLLTEFAMRLGLANVDALVLAQPTDAEQELIRGLISEGHNLHAMLKTCTRTLATERDDLDKLKRNRTTTVPINPEPFYEKYAGLTPVLKTLEKHAETRQEIISDMRSLGDAANRLLPPVADIDVLATSPLPSVETISRFRRDLDALAQDSERARDRLASATDTMDSSRSKLLELTRAGPVPSVEAIAAKRRDRDDHWRTLRRMLFGTSQASGGGELASVVADFERYSAEADQLADRAASDARRVAAYAGEARRLTEGESKAAEARSELAALEEDRHKTLTAWAVVWAPTGLTPLHPSEMMSWRAVVDVLLDRREKLQRLRESFTAMDTALSSIEPAICALAADIGLKQIEGVNLAVVSMQIEDRLASMRRLWQSGRELETRIQDLERRIEHHIAAEIAARDSVEQWSKCWRVAVQAIGLPVTASLAQAEVALSIWGRVPSTVRERNHRLRQCADLQQAVQEYDQHVKILLQSTAPDLVTLAPDAAVKLLNQRLVAVRAAHAQKAESRRRLAAIVLARKNAAVTLAEAERALVKGVAHLPSGIDLENLSRRLAERDRLRAALHEHRTQLISQAEGYEEAKLRADLIDFNPEEVEAALRVLAEEQQILEQEAQQLFADHAQAVRERDAAEHGMGAEVAAQQRSSAEAELIAASREWLVLKLGALLLGTAIDRHRLSQQDPLLLRASVLFGVLTGGSFSALSQAYGEGDVPQLVGLRPSGDTVPVSGMSTGARDQLYLALRLAYLEDYARRAEPAPFVVDDVFATFDEDRTENGLLALAAIGDRVQPIVFTHHRQLADIAQNKLGADVLLL